MALSELYTGSVSISTTEISLVSGTSMLQSVATPGIIQVFMDLSALVDGDEFMVSFYEKVRSASTQRVVQKFNLVDLQADPNWVTPALHLRHGWDVTVIRLAGTDRTLEWSVRNVS